jgi:hypothetical protein
MNAQAKYKLLFLIVSFICKPGISRISQGPVAKFSFNDRKDYDEINPGRKAALVDVIFTEDRFGNKNNAVYVFGNDYSYINLGNYSAIKPIAGSISLWVKIEREVFSGQGYKANPILLTKARKEDDFYEAYGIYYNYDRKKIVANTARDSLRQITITSQKEFSLFEWHHLVVTYDNNFFSFYIDGILERKEVKKFETKFLASDSVLIGQSANKKNDRFSEAAIDDIEFYDRVLSMQEVQDLYHAPNPNKVRILEERVLRVIAILLALFGVYLLVRYQLSITLKKEKKQLELDKLVLETELRVNRALMNPHFVFNSLNALQSLILKKEIDRADDYLVRFSKLMRKILEGNLQEFISLEKEVELLKGYLEIEEMRFEENILYTITVDPAISPSAIFIPIMMLQPFVENSLWHGLHKKNGEKIMKINFFLAEERYLKCIIEDNGVGRKNTLQSVLEKRSLATGFIVKRLNLLNKIYDLNCSLLIEDKPGNDGTVVTITLPVFKNPHHGVTRNSD